MNASMPSFLKISHQPDTRQTSYDQSEFDVYKPLLGLWLIDLSLHRDWVNHPLFGSLYHTFGSENFTKTTGMERMGQIFRLDDDGDRLNAMRGLVSEVETDIDETGMTNEQLKKSRLRQIKVALTSMLKARRQALFEQGVPADLPLFQNVERLASMLQLNESEKAVLAFTSCVRCFPMFYEALHLDGTEVTDSGIATILSVLTGHTSDSLHKALRRNGILSTSGLITVTPGEESLKDKLRLVDELKRVMLETLTDDADFRRQVLTQAKAATLTLEDFSHMARDAQLLSAYFAGALQSKKAGANVLLYGPPGTGKTEFAKALSAQLGLRLFEIRHCDEDGDAISGARRLESFNFCQRTLANQTQVALLFDEIEDVLPGGDDGDMERFGDGGRAARGGKAWINRSLEDNPVPTFWITNNADIDTAYLRRFAYSVRFSVPPRKVRQRIATHYLGHYAPNAATLSAIAELNDMLPSQLEQAAQMAKLCGLASPVQAWSYAELALERSRALLGQSRKSLRPKMCTQYSLDYLNTDTNVVALVEGLCKHPQAICGLYGPPGTGKSQLARFIADELGKPLLVKRASDLLDKYVGSTEQRIAAMFQQAEDEDAVLLLDEADSFLLDRTGAERSWEITQTNEFLTQLECFEGLFFATTNLMDKLDGAFLRRFSHKIKFDYLKPDQCWKLFVQEYLRMGGTLGDALKVQQQVLLLEDLTPADVGVVLKKQVMGSEPISAIDFLSCLQKETGFKRRINNVAFVKFQK